MCRSPPLMPLAAQAAAGKDARHGRHAGCGQSGGSPFEAAFGRFLKGGGGGGNIHLPPPPAPLLTVEYAVRL